MKLFIRAETYPNESRVALVPKDIQHLNSKGFTVWVERSVTRVIPDSEFQTVGCILTDANWWSQESDVLIIGLKELRELDKLDRHTHIYFSHSYKGQTGSRAILEAFSKSNSVLYDFEYFLNVDKTRCLAFGFYAGVVGAALGLKQYSMKKKNQTLHDTLSSRSEETVRTLTIGDRMGDLKPWTSFDDMIAWVGSAEETPSVAIIGNGRCSKGVQHILTIFKIPFTLIHRQDLVDPYAYDMLFNCITLNEEYRDIWVQTNHSKDLLIVDVSCDYSRPNNPIPLYTKATSWLNPVFECSQHVSVIAIENLPSLLPLDASIEFSKLFTDLLLRYGDSCWKDNLRLYGEKKIDIVTERL